MPQPTPEDAKRITSPREETHSVDDKRYYDERKNPAKYSQTHRGGR